MLLRHSLFVGIVIATLSGVASPAQDAPMPPPEMHKLKVLEGTWDATIKAGPMESKGTMNYKSDLGGMWLASEFTGEVGGMKFSGKGFDSYDAGKKKFVSAWFDSFSTSPMLLEGNFDKEGKVMTMTGEGPGADGKPAKYRMTTEFKSKDQLDWTMYTTGPDGKESPMMSMSYKRRK